MKTPKKFKCIHCGRAFAEPVPHKCNGVYRKRNLEFHMSVYDERDMIALREYSERGLVKWVDIIPLGCHICCEANEGGLFEGMTFDSEIREAEEYLVEMWGKLTEQMQRAEAQAQPSSKSITFTIKENDDFVDKIYAFGSRLHCSYRDAVELLGLDRNKHYTIEIR